MASIGFPSCGERLVKYWGLVKCQVSEDPPARSWVNRKWIKWEEKHQPLTKNNLLSYLKVCRVQVSDFFVGGQIIPLLFLNVDETLLVSPSYWQISIWWGSDTGGEDWLCFIGGGPVELGGLRDHQVPVCSHHTFGWIRMNCSWVLCQSPLCLECILNCNPFFWKWL